MKKIIISLVMMFAVAARAFAGDEMIDQKVSKAFDKEFSAAQNVKWSVEKKYYKATFTYYGQVIVALYDKKAYLLGVLKNRLATDLPYYLQRELKEYYGNYWVIDLFELSNEHGTSYHVTLKNSGETITLLSKEQNSWEMTHHNKND